MTKKTIGLIINSADISKDDTILEIGTGKGALTKAIAETGCRIISYEIDTGFKKDHKIIKNKHRNITFIYGNALSADFQQFSKIIANIPYNIAEPLLLKLSRYIFTEGILTVNKSFADKLLEKTPSLLSMIMPSYFRIEHIRDIPRRFFNPPPKTTSSLIKITPIKKEDTIDSKERYIIRLLYDQRSRKVKNALMEAIIDYRTRKNSDFTHSYEVAHASRHFIAKLRNERISDSCKSPRYTKREAKAEIKEFDIKKEILDKTVINLSCKELEKILNKIKK
ncbi:MAG: rRNA adenine dimethyltransferase family protein [archaeon]|nr:rRNA adenine dimethyltransferase family protein [archaeon]